MLPKEVKQVMLSRFNFTASKTIESKYLFDYGNNVQFDVKYLADEMVANLTKTVYGKKAIVSKVSKIIEVPSTWAEHLKERLGLKFKTKEIEVSFDIDVYALFPDL